MAAPLKVARTLRIGDLEVHADGDEILLGHDRSDDGYDVFAQAGDVVTVLEQLLAFARENEPKAPTGKAGK